MKYAPFTVRRCAMRLGQLSLVAGLWLTVPAHADEPAASTNSAATSPNSEADKLWKEVNKSSAPPMTPPSWAEKKPTQEEVAAFFIPELIKGADKAKDFYTRFPDHLKAADAHKLEYRLLSIAIGRFGDTTQTARLQTLETERLKDPKLSEDEKFQLRMGATQRLAQQDNTDEFVKSAQQLQKDFPKKEDVYQLLLMAAGQTEGDKAKTIAQSIVDGPAPDGIKEQAKGLLKKMDAVGKPLDLKYTAVDGRDVQVANLKGKVILVDFWATWCGPCVAELPNVKAAYSKLHDKGFEIVGISFDQSKDSLEHFVAENKMAWPQYFDGEGWGNKFGKQFGINSIPSMWLVDKKGNLRDLNGRDGLEDKVTKLLAE